MKKVITSHVKDSVLLHLIKNYDVGQKRAVPSDLSVGGIEGSTLVAILESFGRLNLITYEEFEAADETVVVLSLNVEAHDFYLQGGFYGHYELFQKNVEKLLWEVEKLERIDGPQQTQVGEIRKKMADYVGIIASLASIGDAAAGMIKG